MDSRGNPPPVRPVGADEIVRAPVSPAEKVLAEPVIAGRTEGPAEYVRASLELRLHALLQHDPGTRTGEDVEDLHQMRVAVRRMRATVKAAHPLVDAAWADDLRTELGWLGGALGPVRDFDVLLLRLRREIAALPFRERAAGEVLLGALEGQRAVAREAMLEALEAPRYTALVQRLIDAVPRPLPLPTTVVQLDLVDLVRAEARKLRRAVERAGEHPPDEVLHALRIRAKRLRYTAEFAGPGFRGAAGGKTIKRLLAATAELQEVLGDHQDACVAEQRIRELLDGPATANDVCAAFVAGRLVERERRRAQQKRGRWRAAWKRVHARLLVLEATATGHDRVSPGPGDAVADHRE
jgi:CHAD domain-containing protein